MKVLVGIVAMIFVMLHIGLLMLAVDLAHADAKLAHDLNVRFIHWMSAFSFVCFVYIMYWALKGLFARPGIKVLVHPVAK